MLKYCRGKLTDTNKLQAVLKFQVIKKVPFRREGGSQRKIEQVLLHELLFEKELRRVAQIELKRIVCWVHGTQTHKQTCFSWLKILLEK